LSSFFDHLLKLFKAHCLADQICDVFQIFNINETIAILIK
jgi:hypothetical protein